jgi:5-methylcytosine-specific restriction endonuclease McrA
MAERNYSVRRARSARRRARRARNRGEPLPPHVFAEDARLVWREEDFRQVFPIPSRHVGIGAYKDALRWDPCAYCGRIAPVGEYGGQEIDHIHSLFRGGPDHWSNFTAACSFCNAFKLDMVLGWMLELRELEDRVRRLVRVEVVRA